MTIFDRAADSRLFFQSGWQDAQAPSIPSGGAVIDVEARAALAQLIDALREGGLIV